MKKIISTLFLAAFLLNVHAQTLIEATFLESRNVNQISADFGIPVFFFNNGVHLYKVTYNTPDIDGNNSLASGLVAIPDVDAVYPLLSYQHGTVGSREDVPSNLAGDPLGILFSAMGYVTASADFIGLGDSPGPHPYVHAATEASAGIDILFAVQELLAQEDQTVQLNDQLFVTGYSQGGHAAAALHREVQQNYGDDFIVTASAPMSGPYSISGAMRDLILSDEEYFSTAYIPNTMLSYNAVYDIYPGIADFFKAEYVPAITQFANEEITLWELETQLQALLQSNEGGSFPKRMLLDELVTAVESDPDHPVNVALADNDVYEWAPDAPTRLYYCTADDQVPFENSIIADEGMNAAGAMDIFSEDVNSTADHGGCVVPAVTATITFFAGFQDIQALPTSSTDLILNLENVEITPNPATDFVQITHQTGSSEEGIVTFFDNQGKEVLHQTVRPNDSNRIMVSDLAQGLYWVRVQFGNRRAVERIIVK